MKHQRAFLERLMLIVATVSAATDLQDWLIALKNKVYDSEGNAYDNGTAILVRFD